MPMVALLLAVETATSPEFANLSGLPKADEEPIVVPAFQGVRHVFEC